MSYRPQPGTIPVTADNAHEMGEVWLTRANCDRQAKADLPGIVARGLGDRPIVDLKFRCSHAAAGRCTHADI
jgi:hypothetical protein